MSTSLQDLLIELSFWLLLVVLLLALVVINPLTINAQSSTIIISELYPAPTSGEPEWVELLNTSNQPIVLTGWWLSDELTSPSVIYRFTAADLTLQPGEFRQFLLSSSRLNNTGDGVRLFNADGVEQSRLVYTNSQASQSQQRATLESDETVRATPTPNADHPLYSLLPLLSSPAPSPSPTATPTSSPTPCPSPTITPSPAPTATPTPSSTLSPTATPTATATPTPTPTPAATPIALGQILVSELMACPTGGQPEWIEVFNNGASVTASNWRITDQSGNYRTINGTVLSQRYTQFSWSGSVLNNTGDSFDITTDAGQIIDSVSYESCTSGKSLILDADDNWIAATPTPGASNPQPSPEPTPTPTPSATSASAATSVVVGKVNSPAPTPSPPVTSQGTAQAVPWINPELIALETPFDSTAAAQLSAIGSADGSAILGAATTLPSSGRPWWLLFVIMAGLLFALSGLLPPYATALEKINRLGLSLAPPDALGRADLHF